MYGEIDMPLDEARAIDGIYDEVPGSHDGGVALARAALELMSGFQEVIAADARWACSRSHKEFQVIAQGMRLTEVLWRTMQLGIIAANWNDPPTWHKEVLRDAAKIAQKAVRNLERFLPRELDRRWRKLSNAGEVLDCADAWQEALPLIKEPTRLSRTEAAVRAVIVAKPELGSRLRLDDAIKNSKTMSVDVFNHVRSYWGKGNKLVRVPRREVAHELTALACGVDTANSVHHLCDFARAANLGRQTLV